MSEISLSRSTRKTAAPSPAPREEQQISFPASGRASTSFALQDVSGLVVGTAGHIDHGKTSLVRALTGIDTDRLVEEKRRGISIDLGFAHLTLPDGLMISFIDVPGHERFVKNMLAGAGGMEAVLLVVAADESVKPQTREHFDICRLLGIQTGMVVLTKVDLASPEQRFATRENVQALCKGSFLEDAPVVEVSAVTGEGLEEVRHRLRSLARNRSGRDEGGIARLPLDRSFALKGFGTVVTGTLWNGSLHTGQTVRIAPKELEGRIRSLQVHGRAVDVARAGQRTAVNLAGLDASEIQRGFVLTSGSSLAATRVLDVNVEWLDEDSAPAGRAGFFFHIGTSEVKGALKPHRNQQGRRMLARLHLDEPVLALPGDRFVLRRPSPPLTVAGGTVVDAFPPLRINRARTVTRLTKLSGSSLAERVRLLVEEPPSGRTLEELVRMTGRGPDELKAVVKAGPGLIFVDQAQRIVSGAWLEDRRKKLVTWLAVFHDKNPSLAGASTAQARLGLESTLAQLVFDNFALIRVGGDTVSLARHQAKFTGQESAALKIIEQAFRNAGYQPPAPAEALKAAGTEGQKGRALLETLIKTQKLVRVSDDLVFHAEVISHIRQSLSAHKGRRFSVPEFKEWTNVSRKYAIPLLEFLDHQRVTKREGDARIVL